MSVRERRMVQTANRRRTRARRSRRTPVVSRSWLKAILVLMIPVAIVAGTTYGAVAAAISTPLPSPSVVVDSTLPSDTLVYDRTGKVLLADVHKPGFYHYQQSLSAMGKWLPEATVAVEDSHFWSEPAVDPNSIIRAALVDLEARRIVEGGSTITQQLVKMEAVGSQQTITRKLREADLALQVGSQYSKVQILQSYLNDLDYGNFAYGPQAAAQIYFHENTSQLDLAQATMLAGLPQDPALLDPLLHWNAAKARQGAVLAAMVRNQMITQAQADQAAKEDLSPPQHMFTPQETNLTPAFTGYVMSELDTLLGSQVVAQGGLTVTTTLNWNLQQQAQSDVTQGVASERRYNVTDGAMVAMDPQTGQVLAMVGSAGPNVPGADYNFAVWPPRDPGSSFKIYTYSAAIASRLFTMVTPILDAPLVVNTPGSTVPYTPKNYDLRYHGVCQVQVCLGNSLNVPAVEVETTTGVATVAQTAQSFNAPPYYPEGSSYSSSVPASDFQPSMTLGGYGETPLQMASGVSTLADLGVTHRPQVVLAVSTESGRKRLPANPGTRVLDAGAAYIMAQMLSNNSNRSMTFGYNNPLVVPGYQVAAKTGTSDNFTDGWTVGYNPSLAVAIWVGNANYSPIAWGEDAIFVASPIWHRFFLDGLHTLNAKNTWYQMPSDVYQAKVNGQPAYFLSGTSPSQPTPPLPNWVTLNGRPGGGSGPSGVTSPSQSSSSVPTGPGCRTWTYNGAQYWACTSSPSGLPGDPLAG